MPPIAIAFIVFGCSMAFALIGMVLHVKLPDNHLDSDSRDVVKLVMALIASVSALVLSLLIASANTSYDQQNSQLKALSANLILLDRTLELYGPDAKAARDGLYDDVRRTHDQIWSPDGVRPEMLNSPETRRMAKASIERMQKLSPKTEEERAMQTQAEQLAQDIIQTRLLMSEELGDSISWPFMTVLVFWIGVLFLGFGLFSRFNATVTVALFVGALSMGGAIFLLLELNDPYHGLMRLSDDPLRNAMAVMDQ
jgi:hypothetical protein